MKNLSFWLFLFISSLLLSIACSKEETPLSSEDCPEEFVYFDNKGGGNIHLSIDGKDWMSCRAIAQYQDTTISSFNMKLFNISGITYKGILDKPERIKLFSIIIGNLNGEPIEEGVYPLQSSDENPEQFILVQYSDIQYNGTPTSGIPTAYVNDQMEPILGDFIEIKSMDGGYVKGKIKMHLGDIDTGTPMVLVEGEFDVKIDN